MWISGKFWEILFAYVSKIQWNLVCSRYFSLFLISVHLWFFCFLCRIARISKNSLIHFPKLKTAIIDYYFPIWFLIWLPNWTQCTAIVRIGFFFLSFHVSCVFFLSFLQSEKKRINWSFGKSNDFLVMYEKKTDFLFNDIMKLNDIPFRIAEWKCK